MAIAKLFSSSPVLIFCLVSLVHPLPFSFKITNKDEPLSHNLGRLPLPSNFFSKGELHPSTDDDMEAKFYAAVFIETRKANFSVSSRFLSLSVSPKRVAGMSCIPWDTAKLQVIAHGLTPAWLRIGGTEADYVTFVPPTPFNSTLSIGDNDDEEEDVKEDPVEDYSGFEDNDSAHTAGTNSNAPQKASKIHCRMEEEEEVNVGNNMPVALEMFPYEWDRVHKFARKVGWNVIFALNVQLRDYNDEWNVSNAASLIEYSAQQGYNTAWELGNEPTRFPFLPNATTIFPEQLAYDFSSLRNLLEGRQGGTQFMAGPDISKPSTKILDCTKDEISHKDYLKRFLAAGVQAGGVVDAVTWHQYYIDGRSATMRHFLSSSIMDQLHKEIAIIHSVVRNYTRLPVWLGETAGAYHGGAPGLSNTFVGGFLFMDKLGLAAASGIKVMMKQTLIGLNGLLQQDLTPLPTYWIAVLHKQLVGTKVLSVRNGLAYGRKARIYAHCTKFHLRPPVIIPKYYYGDITLLVVNIHHSPVELILINELDLKSKDVYFFTPLDYNMKSKNVGLNGMKLSLKSNGKLPQFYPVNVARKKQVVVPAFSCGYVVIKNAQAKACMKY